MNNKRFFMKLLGVFMIEVTNFTPEKLASLLWKITFMIILVVGIFKLPEIINAIRWW